VKTTTIGLDQAFISGRQTPSARFNSLLKRQVALEKTRRDHASWTPAVVGAVIEPGLCLDLSTDAGIEHVKLAHRALVDIFEEAQVELPRNGGGADLLLRKLDCAVLRMLHDIRASQELQPIDTVSGIFIEGGEAYPTSGFREKLISKSASAIL
jgi:hypothetical protein